MEVLGLGYRIPFLRVPLLSLEPIPIASYPPLSTKGIDLEEVTLSLVERGAVELAPLPSPGFFSRMFIVWKTSGIAWTIPSLSHGRTLVSRIYFGGWTQTVFVAGYVCLSSHPTTTSGQARPTWAGVLNSVPRSFWASGFRKRRLYPRELLAVEQGLLHFHSSVSHSTVAVFVDNSTAVAYLCNAGGTRSLALNSIVQRILRWSELRHVRLAPQFIMGRHNVLADSLSRPDQVQGSEWTLHMEVFLELRRRWPVMVDIFATSANHRCSIYFSPFRDPQAMGTDALLQATVPCWLLSSVFSFSTCPLIRSCVTWFAHSGLRLPSSCCVFRPGTSLLLQFLSSPLFEPLQQAFLHDLTKKVLFLVALVTAKRVGEL